MNYREQLERVKFQKDDYIRTMRRMDSTYSSVMDERTKRFNEERERMRIQDFDREIARLEPLAKKELEDEIWEQALSSVKFDEKQITKELEKCLKKAFKDIKLF